MARQHTSLILSASTGNLEPKHWNIPHNRNYLQPKQQWVGQHSYKYTQSAIQGDLTFDKVERTLRDQEEELLNDERYGRSSGKGAKGPHPRRSYWAETDGVWGILPDDYFEEVPDDVILWCHGETEAMLGPEEETATAWTVTPTGNQLEWTLWEDEWYTQDEEGCWWSHPETQPWLDIEEILALDEKAGQELAEIYGQFEAKRRSFHESRQVVKNKLLGRGFFPPKGKGKKPKGSKGKGSGQIYGFAGSSGKGKGKQLPGNPNFTGCFICGSKDHDYRNCPKRTSGSASKALGKGSANFLEGAYFVTMASSSQPFEASLTSKNAAPDTSQSLPKSIHAVQQLPQGRLRFPLCRLPLRLRHPMSL